MDRGDEREKHGQKPYFGKTAWTGAQKEDMYRGVVRVFGARGAYFRLASPKKNYNSPKFAKSLELPIHKIWLFENKLIFSLAIFSSGGSSGPNNSIFLEDFICFLSMWRCQLTMIFLRNRLKLFYKTVTLYYLLASLAFPSNLQPGARGGSPPLPLATSLNMSRETRTYDSPSIKELCFELGTEYLLVRKTIFKYQEGVNSRVVDQWQRKFFCQVMIGHMEWNESESEDLVETECDGNERLL